jgi:hypothetical protein
LSILHFQKKSEMKGIRVLKMEKGYAIGDFYFSTLIQLSKDRKFPNTMLRLATKTASGNQLEGARYTDSPGYFFDLSFSKELAKTESGMFRPFGLAGFYTWQTNDELNLQNDAFLYALGADYERNSMMFSASWSGYSGYKTNATNPCNSISKSGRILKVKHFAFSMLTACATGSTKPSVFPLSGK